MQILCIEWSRVYIEMEMKFLIAIVAILQRFYLLRERDADIDIEVLCRRKLQHSAYMGLYYQVCPRQQPF